MPTPVEFTAPLPNLEVTPPAAPEREMTPERGQEVRQQTMPAAPVPTQTQLPTPVVQPAQDGASTAVPADDTTPTVAADEDLIEKEWVDKAKKIIQDTRNDPHAREQRVGKLQADYLKKRYGKELGNQT